MKELNMCNIPYIIGRSIPAKRPIIPPAIPVDARPRCSHRSASLFHCIATAVYRHPDTGRPVCPYHYPGTYRPYLANHDRIT